jgi:hypothetical protein
MEKLMQFSKFDQLVNAYKEARFHYYAYEGLDGPKDKAAIQRLWSAVLRTKTDLLQYVATEWEKQKADGIELRNFASID